MEIREFPALIRKEVRNSDNAVASLALLNNSFLCSSKKKNEIGSPHFSAACLLMLCKLGGYYYRTTT